MSKCDGAVTLSSYCLPLILIVLGHWRVPFLISGNDKIELDCISGVNRLVQHYSTVHNKGKKTNTYNAVTVSSYCLPLLLIVLGDLRGLFLLSKNNKMELDCISGVDRLV
eukprot:5261278-Ditylum_brightwellii.AAC.1